MSYHFIREYDEDQQLDKETVIVKSDNNHLGKEDLYNLFQRFMQACGFVFDKDELVGSVFEDDPNHDCDQTCSHNEDTPQCQEDQHDPPPTAA